MEPSREWWVQAQAVLAHARHSYDAGDYDWACFACHQGAEKAIKAMFQRNNLEARGHAASLLLGVQTENIVVSEVAIESAKSLDKLYIPTRYPSGFEQGKPTEFYTRREAEEAIGFRQSVMDFCAGRLT